MSEIITVIMSEKQFEIFEENYKNSIDHGVDKDGIFKFITVEFRVYEKELKNV